MRAAPFLRILDRSQDNLNRDTVTNTRDPTRDVLAAKENKVGTTTTSNYTHGVNQLGQSANVSQAVAAFQATRKSA